MKIGTVNTGTAVTYLDVLGSFLISSNVLTRGLGARPVLQTRRPNGTEGDEVVRKGRF
jgi:hypothetical protein